MKIAILGYGKMGKEIEAIAIAKGHEIVLKINIENQNELTLENLKLADVAIEFSTPQSAIANIKMAADAGIPIVVGTTAWYEHFEEAKKYVLNKSGSLFYATNYSIGVNLFWRINQMSAKLMKDYNYHLSMDEIHHTQKLDAPSGTAITTAEIILKEIDVLKTWTNKIVTRETEGDHNIEQNKELLIRSFREDQVPGTHTVYYDSNEDSISISHVAHSRKGFASGAVLAAEWILNKKGIFNMNDLLSF